MGQRTSTVEDQEQPPTAFEDEAKTQEEATNSDQALLDELRGRIQAYTCLLVFIISLSIGALSILAILFASFIQHDTFFVGPLIVALLLIGVHVYFMIGFRRADTLIIRIYIGLQAVGILTGVIGIIRAVSQEPSLPELATFSILIGFSIIAGYLGERLHAMISREERLAKQSEKRNEDASNSVPSQVNSN